MRICRTTTTTTSVYWGRRWIKASKRRQRGLCGDERWSWHSSVGQVGRRASTGHAAASAATIRSLLMSAGLPVPPWRHSRLASYLPPPLSLARSTTHTLRHRTPPVDRQIGPAMQRRCWAFHQRPQTSNLPPPTRCTPACARRARQKETTTSLTRYNVVVVLSSRRSIHSKTNICTMRRKEGIYQRAARSHIGMIGIKQTSK